MNAPGAPTKLDKLTVDELLSQLISAACMSNEMPGYEDAIEAYRSEIKRRCRRKGG